jgi:hypothetical protein
MALEVTIKGQGNADVSYHMIPSVNGYKVLKPIIDGQPEDPKYGISFNLVGFFDEATRKANPNGNHLSSIPFTKEITEEQMGFLIQYLGLYDHVKATDARFANAVDIL